MSKENPGAVRRFWRFLRAPSRRFSVLAVLLVGFVAGVLWWGAFNTGMEATNQLEFCIGCHAMRDNVYKEYVETIHYKNRTGVRAICSDCHVPHDWTHKLIRKIIASREVWGTITGYVDTPAKFEAHRMELASHEWERMKATDSRECRNCHSFDAMSADVQKQSVYKRHMEAQKAGQTCIDCHKGIAHHLPKEYRDPNEEE